MLHPTFIRWIYTTAYRRPPSFRPDAALLGGGGGGVERLGRGNVIRPRRRTDGNANLRLWIRDISSAHAADWELPDFAPYLPPM